MSKERSANLSTYDKKTGPVLSETSIGNVENIHLPKTLIQRFVGLVEVQEPGEMTMKEMFLYNHDLKPVERKRQCWTAWDFLTFWIADALNVNNLQIASTGMVAGLTWWQTWISVWLGYFIAGLFVAATSRIGGSYHINFPVACRASFGPFGSIWPVLNRVFMSIIWCAVHTWIGGECVQLMLMAIFGLDLDQRIGTQHLSGTTSFKFLSFFIAWVLQLPFMWLHPHQLKYVFNVKALVAPAVGIAYLAWVLGKNGGVGPNIHAKSSLEGSELAWAFVNSTMNCIAKFAALILNAADFGRFAKTHNASWVPQIWAIPLSFSVATLFGILATTAGEMLFSKTYWSPLDILGQLLKGWKGGDRAGVFFISFGLLFAEIGSNLAANAVPCGIDLTALVPRFLTIRRGSFICAGLALCLVPWNFFGSASNFTTYLSAYSIFLSSIAGVMICDYYWVRRGFYNVYELFDADPKSTYGSGKFGINWRGYVAYILGVIPTLPGFIRKTGVDSIGYGAIYVYRLNYFVGFIVAASIYMLLNYFWPASGIPEPVERKPFAKGWFEEFPEVDDFERQFFGRRLATTVRRSMDSVVSMF